MPLHLLGKKSWNVYNAANIARVRADEEAAARAEEAEEQRLRERDAARRMAILRGEMEEHETKTATANVRTPRRGRDGDSSNLDDNEGAASAARSETSTTAVVGRKSKRPRKRHGEDDTDFEMRLARERADRGVAMRERLGVDGRRGGAIVDERGHIDLFGGTAAAAAAKNSRNVESGEMTECAGGMRFADATGRLSKARSTPWYSFGLNRKAATDEDLKQGLSEAQTQNQFGEDDPGKRLRTTARVLAEDPLAMMKSGAKRARDVDRERRREKEKREKEVEGLIREEKRRTRRKRRNEEGRREHHRPGGGRPRRDDEEERDMRHRHRREEGRGTPRRELGHRDHKDRFVNDHRRRNRSKERRSSRSPRKENREGFKR